MPQSFTGLRLVLLTFALGLGTFIQVLDTSIANVAVAYIAGDLAISPDEGTWVITSFSISNGIMLALTGWLSKRVGGVKLFIWSTSLFSITSFLCGISWNLTAIVVFRILQGASAGSLIPLSQALLINHYPEDKRGLALGFWSTIVVVAPIMGPVLGGYITDNYGWRWIFYINIPLGFLSSWMTWILLGAEKVETKKVPIDTIGLSLLVIGLITLQIFLDRGNDLDWLNSSFILTMLAICLTAFLFFIPWNLYSPYPIMNFDYLRYPNFALGTVVAALIFFMFFGTTVLLPLWLETQMGYNAFWAGIAVMPIGILPVFFSFIVGKYVGRVDVRWMVFISLISYSFTSFWMSGLTPNVSLYKLMEPRFWQGLGLTFYLIPIITLTLSYIPSYELTGASGMFNFVRLIAGGGFGTSVYTTLWNRREIFHYSRLAENITPYNPLSRQLYHTLDQKFNSATASSEVIDLLIQQQASLLAVNDLFWMTGWIFVLLIPTLWFFKPPPARQHAAIAAE